MLVAGIRDVCAGAGAKVVAQVICRLGLWCEQVEVVSELLCIKVFVAVYPRCMRTNATKRWPKR